MTATNHAISGALIGLAFATPDIAIPLAFVYHFAQDAVPHYDPPGSNKLEILRADRFRRQLLVDASLCGLLVLVLVLTRPQHWLVAIISAFACAAPDLFWIPHYRAAQKGEIRGNTNWFWRFHAAVQWKTGPELWWVEAAWFVVFGGLLAISV